MLRNECLAAENEILRSKLPGRVPMSNHARIRLAKLGRRIGMRAPKDIAAVVTVTTPSPAQSGNRADAHASVRITTRFSAILDFCFVGAPGQGRPWCRGRAGRSRDG